MSSAEVFDGPTTRSTLELHALNHGFKVRGWTLHAPVSVGRKSSDEIQLNEEEGTYSVSRSHAFLWHSDSRWWVLDRNSTNGTYVNGVRIGSAAVPLKLGDIVQFAKVACVVRKATVAPSVRPARRVPDETIPFQWPGTTEEFLRVGSPLNFDSLRIFPLYSMPVGKADYLLSQEAMALGVVTVSEVSEEGNVPELRVDNRDERRVLFFEGEELRGGKQNRVLNSCVLVPGRSEIPVPVSCVERGRWRYTDGGTRHGASIGSARIRRALRTSVNQSLSQSHGHLSDQGSVWNEVQSQHDTLLIQSPTQSMTDTMVHFGSRIAEVQDALPYIEGSSGLAVAVGSKLVSLDLFDSPSTCERMWNPLLGGLAIDQLMSSEWTTDVDRDELIGMLHQAASAKWHAVPAVGDGEGYRTGFGGTAGTALVLNGGLVHGSLVF